MRNIANNNYYVFYNPNPKQRWHKDGTPVTWDRCDCAVRSLSRLENMSWREAFEYLTAKAMRHYMMPNDDKLLRIVYQGLGYTRGTFKSAERMQVKDFCHKHRKGRFLLNVRGHVCALVDGKIYDCWDCGDSWVTSWWEAPTE